MPATAISNSDSDLFSQRFCQHRPQLLGGMKFRSHAVFNLPNFMGTLFYLFIIRRAAGMTAGKDARENNLFLCSKLMKSLSFEIFKNFQKWYCMAILIFPSKLSLAIHSTRQKCFAELIVKAQHFFRPCCELCQLGMFHEQRYFQGCVMLFKFIPSFSFILKISERIRFQCCSPLLLVFGLYYYFILLPLLLALSFLRRS